MAVADACALLELRDCAIACANAVACTDEGTPAWLTACDNAFAAVPAVPLVACEPDCATACATALALPIQIHILSVASLFAVTNVQEIMQSGRQEIWLVN